LVDWLIRTRPSVQTIDLPNQPINQSTNQPPVLPRNHEKNYTNRV